MEVKAVNGAQSAQEAVVDFNLGAETITGFAPVDSETPAQLNASPEQLVSGVGTVGEMALRAGIRAGAPFEVVVPRGAVGFREVPRAGFEVTSDAVTPSAPGTVSGSTLSGADENVLIAGQGPIGLMAVQNGIPAGSEFKVVTYRGKTGFLPA